MTENKRQTYLKIAHDTGLFKKNEIDILNELLVDCQKNLASSYVFIEENMAERVAGFAIFGRTPLTEFSWDIYWMVVDKNFQRKGIGEKLMRRIEESTDITCGKKILRVETSARKEYCPARNFYAKQGFSETGRIPNFYSEGDDLVVLCKFR